MILRNELTGDLSNLEPKQLDAINELLKRQTCEHCKHAVLEQVMSTTNLYQCNNCESETHTLTHNKDFGCNKWERKKR